MHAVTLLCIFILTDKKKNPYVSHYSSNLLFVVVSHRNLKKITAGDNVAICCACEYFGVGNIC